MTRQEYERAAQAVLIGSWQRTRASADADNIVTAPAEERLHAHYATCRPLPHGKRRQKASA